MLISIMAFASFAPKDKLELIKRTYRELYGPEADAFYLNDLTYNHIQEALLHWQHKIVK